MAKNHLKSIAAPKTWYISRKERKYIARQNPGAHKLAYSMPLSLVMNELTKVAKTAREIKYIISKKDVFVDKKKRIDERH
jgi:small subunit ribosomal protein S4e